MPAAYKNASIGEEDIYFVRHLFVASLLLISMPASAIEDGIHDKCIKAADYAGCVQVLSGNTTVTESQFDKLLNALKLVPSRLENTNRRDFYENIQPFSDTLGLIDQSQLSNDHENYVHTNAQIVSRLLNEIAQTWSDQISLRIKYEYYLKPACDNARLHISNFNSSIPEKYSVEYRPWTKKVLWQTTNGCQDPTAAMIVRLSSYIDEITEDPVKKKVRLAKANKEKELCAMAPWQRYLEENPGMKAWSEANPGPAEKQKQKFLAEPNNSVSCGSTATPSKSKTNNPRYTEEFIMPGVVGIKVNCYPVSQSAESDNCIVVEVIKGSPAHKDGRLSEKDRILEVNGKKVRGIRSTKELVEMIGGQVGTYVTFVIDADGEERSITLKRVAASDVKID